jgi:hypothetical protein
VHASFHPAHRPPRRGAAGDIAILRLVARGIGGVFEAFCFLVSRFPCGVGTVFD